MDVELDFGDCFDERVLGRCDGGSELSAVCDGEGSFDVGQVDDVFRSSTIVGTMNVVVNAGNAAWSELRGNRLRDIYSIVWVGLT